MSENKRIILRDLGYQCELFGRIKKSIPTTTRQMVVRTGILRFLKVRFMSPHFSERPTLVPVLGNRKNSEEDFQFYGKRWKAKIATSVGPAARERESLVETVHTQSRAVRVASSVQLLPQDLHSAAQHQPPELWTVPVSTCALPRFTLCIP